MENQRAQHESNNESPWSNWEDFWQSIEAETKQELTQILVKFSTSTEQEREEELKRAVEGEKEFVKLLFEKINSIVGQKTTSVLFDIDETIGSPKYVDDNTLITILRPSILRILKTLKEQRIKAGFFTARGKEYLEQQLKDQNHLATIADYIDPELVFSSQGFGTGNLNIPSIKREFGGPDGFLDDALLENDDDVAVLDIMGAQMKLELLDSIKDKLQGQVIIVDDFEYPKFLTGKHGIHGLALPQKAKFNITS